MMQVTKSFIKLVLMCAFLISNIANGAGCFEPSPNLEALGDEYYDLDKEITLANDAKDLIEALFESIHGNWKGNGVHIECFGTENAPEERTDDIKITVKTELSQPLNLVLNVEVNYIKDGITQGDRINLIGTTPLYAFESVDTNHITFYEKYRSSTGKKFSRLVENFYEIKLNGNNLHLIKIYYINGIYVAKDDWLLNPT